MKFCPLLDNVQINIDVLCLSKLTFFLLLRSTSMGIGFAQNIKRFLEEIR
jgi:hypothetical protein